MPATRKETCPGGKVAEEARIGGLPPRLGADPRILLLGSLPGSRSLAERAYYAHPGNRFWRVMEHVLGQPLLHLALAERIPALAGQGIALWDVVESATRVNSGDHSIGAAVLNDVPALLRQAPGIEIIGFNGKTAWNLAAPWRRACPVPCVALPSTSGASPIPVARLVEAWMCLRPHLPAG